MQAKTDTDVLIIGAGPAGLALTAALRRLGVASITVDRQAAGANTSRAAVVHARTLEVLAGIEATQELLEKGVKVPIFRVRDRDRLLLEIDFSSLDTDYPFTLMCPQNVTEDILLRRVQALGGSIERPVELVGLKASTDGIRATLRDGRGDREVSAGWIVGCDGAHSIVRQQAGIPFEGGAYDERFVLADVRMDWPHPREEVDLFFSPDGLVVVAPLPGDHFRIVATAAAVEGTIDAQFLQSLLDARGPSSGTRIREIVWSSQFHLQHRVSASPRAGRILLCGDAAHVHSPAGGQGMNTGIQDAISLSRPLANALRSDDETGLNEWAKRRHAVAHDVVTLTDRMTRAATASSTVARTIRNALLVTVGHVPALTERLARRLAELDYR